MGAQQSRLAGSNSRPVARVERNEVRRTPQINSLNEKFQTVYLNEDQTPQRPAVLSETGRVSRAKAENYVRQLLKDPKNRLGLSALSTNNLSQVCIRVTTSTYLAVCVRGP